MAADSDHASSFAFAQPVVAAARALIGMSLLVDGVGGEIVETEAYARDDPAAHSFRGVTPRTAAMFGPVGHVYIYRSYGLHWCLNIVAGTVPGEAVLIRALRPTHGLDIMADRRGVISPRTLCGGPGRLAQALGITGALNGFALDDAPFRLIERAGDPVIVAGPRIGISKAIEQPWRFGVAGSPFVSRPLRQTPTTGQAGAPASGAATTPCSSPRE